MIFFNPLSAAAAIAKGAGLVMVGALGLVIVHNLQAAEGRRVKIHVMEQITKINQKAHKEELAQAKTEAKLSAEQDNRVEKAETVQYEKGDVRTCPIEKLRCVEES